MIITDLEKLCTPAEPLEFITETGIAKSEGEQIIEKLKAELTNNNLVAVAAPQIGINKRIFCIKFNDQVKTFIDPVITKKSGSVIAPETFSSMPGKEILIARPEEITVVYYTEEFKYEDNKLIGIAARIFDQMAQLLDGILPSDLGLVSDIEEDGTLFDLTDEEMSQMTELYKHFIATKTKTLTESITEEEQADFRKLKFSESVINGRSQIVENDTKQKQAQNKIIKAQNKAVFNNFIKAKRN